MSEQGDPVNAGMTGFFRAGGAMLAVFIFVIVLPTVVCFGGTFASCFGLAAIGEAGREIREQAEQERRDALPAEQENE